MADFDPTELAMMMTALTSFAQSLEREASGRPLYGERFKTARRTLRELRDQHLRLRDKVQGILMDRQRRDAQESRDMTAAEQYLRDNPTMPPIEPRTS